MGMFDAIISKFAPTPEDNHLKMPEDRVEPAEALTDEIKQSKLKPNHIDHIIDLVSNGKAMPGTKQFIEALGLGASQNGIIPTANLGPLGALRDRFSPKAQEIIRQQEMANKIGDMVLESTIQAKAAHAASLLGAPKTIGDVRDAGLDSLIKPTDAQRFSRAPYNPDIHPEGINATPPVNPNAELSDWQRALAAKALGSLGAGHLMPTPEGVTPTSYVAAQGRKVDPETSGQYIRGLEAAGAIPAGSSDKIAPVITKPVPPNVLTSLGQLATHSYAEQATKGKGMLSQDVRDTLRAHGWDETPKNISAAMDIVKANKALVARQEHMNRAGSDLQNGFASQKYSKLYHELDDREKKDVDAMTMKFHARQAAYHTASVIQATNETAPLNEKAFQYINAKGEKASAGMTHPEALAQGFIPVPQSAIDAVGAANASKHIVGEYKDVIKKVLVKATGSTAIDFAKVNLNKLKSWVLDHAGDPDVQQLEALNANLSTYSKAFMDSGNVGMGEQIMKLKALPSWGSTVDSAMSKLTLMERMLDNIVKSRGIPVDQSQNVYSKPNLSAAERYKELKKTGMDEKAIYKQLAEEGH